jgi:hypothetical protein
MRSRASLTNALDRRERPPKGVIQTHDPAPGPRSSPPVSYAASQWMVALSAPV